jgi:hypothetical protein
VIYLTRRVAAGGGRGEGHLQLRAGRFRLLYRVRGGAVVIVAVTGGAA